MDGDPDVPVGFDRRMLLREGNPLTREHVDRLTSDNPRDIVYRSDLDGRSVWISPVVSEVTDWTVADLLGTVITDLVHPDDWAASNVTRQALRQGRFVPDAAAGDEPPVRVRMRSGSYRWMSVIAVPYLDADGRPAGIVGRLRDVDDLVRAKAAAEANEARLQATITNLLDPLVLLEPVRVDGSIVDFTCIEANPAACDYAGLDRTALVGSTLLELMPGHVTGGGLELLVAVVETGEPLVAEDFPYEQELRGGELRYYDLRIARAGDLLVYTFRDTTDRRSAAQSLTDREELYRLVTEDVTDAVVRYSADTVITWVSPSFERLTGYSADAIVGTSGYALLTPDQQAEAHELLRRRISGERTTTGTRIHLQCADGSRRWVVTRSRPFTHADGTTDGYVTVIRDIDEQVSAQHQLQHDIGHDALTGLANRELALARIDRAVDDLGGHRHSIGLLCIGIDRLTTVNQALTYAAGDFVLTSIATRVAGAVGDPDRVARVAGDEFVVLLPDLSSPAEAAMVADRLCEAARGSLTVEGHTIEPSVSIGIAVGHRGSTSEELLRQASLAARQAKDAGRDRWQFIDPQTASEAQQRLTVESDLRDVIRSRGIAPWFQPVVTLADRRLHGYEALARWTGPDGRQMQPEEFLPVAESTGLVVDIDAAVLAGALDVLIRSGVEHMAVNISPPSLTGVAHVDRLAAIIAESGVDPRRLRLEVTETALLDVSPDVGQAMSAIAAMGPTWYVDDFGTGYSSISHLRDLPVGGLKLDKSFTAGIRVGDRTCIQLAQGLIGLAEGLGLDTVAEGVETEFEAGALLGQGWHQGQGWLFGKPQPLLLAP